MSLPTYPEYKDSHVTWLGRVPAHWRVDRFKVSISSCKNGIWGDEPSDDGNEIACVRVADFDRAKLVVRDYIPTLRSVSHKERVGRLLEKGDLLLEKSGGGELQPVGQVVMYHLDMPAVCSNFVAKMSLARDMVPTYWNYVHSAAYAVGVNVGAINQTSGIQNLDQDRYFNERAPFPPPHEQAAIAAFLDRETGKINALVAEQEKLLVLLAEKRQATISHAVTRGLNPDAPVKDSGVAWLGEVPAHWEVCRVKDVARLESGHTPSKQFPEYWENCEIPWVSLNDSKYLAKHDYISDTAVKINELGLANSSARMLPAGAVVFTRDATIGLAAITTKPMAVSQHLIAWCPSPLISALYLLRVFNVLKPFLDSYTFGATLKTIGMGDVKKLVTPVPPPSEQEAIVRFIECETAKLDALTEKAQKAIDLLRERRSALIAAAITGKIDARNELPQELAA